MIHASRVAQSAKNVGLANPNCQSNPIWIGCQLDANPLEPPWHYCFSAAAVSRAMITLPKWVLRQQLTANSSTNYGQTSSLLIENTCSLSESSKYILAIAIRKESICFSDAPSTVGINTKKKQSSDSCSPSYVKSSKKIETENLTAFCGWSIAEEHSCVLSNRKYFVTTRCI